AAEEPGQVERVAAQVGPEPAHRAAPVVAGPPGGELRTVAAHGHGPLTGRRRATNQPCLPAATDTFPLLFSGAETCSYSVEGDRQRGVPRAVHLRLRSDRRGCQRHLLPGP